MRRLIPASVLSVCAEISASRETHATLDSLFIYAGAPGEPPPGSKPAKALAWLRNTNKEESINPLIVLGSLIENYMEAPLDPENTLHEDSIKDRARIEAVLAQCELQYVKGGKIIGSLGTSSRTLGEFIKDRDLKSVEIEFNRALSSVEISPREAVSAASNILESVCKVYISEERLDMPAKQDLRAVWTVVRKHLGFDPSKIEDDDLQKILSGLISITDGIGSLRTHASSAHGAGKTSYKIEPRHARLAIHASHTVTLFILESWQKKERD
ncbi:hypothetical protein GALL_227220 [mine drainage metagenome]|uniref:Abortive infection protein-like C-terminal domain-containing protein n=1 Tax=mine drainage metagenome TaxID=410659 RepID=A0A1J5RT42_9ZZZZ